MIRIGIPGAQPLEIAHLLLDYNGTIACDGMLKEGVAARLAALCANLQVHVLTADTYGSVAHQCRGIAPVHVIGKEHQAEQKLEYLHSLGALSCIAIGNGKNDALMLSEAALGFAVVQEEGVCTQSLLASDVLFRSIEEALDALLHPTRLAATLRS